MAARRGPFRRSGGGQRRRQLAGSEGVEGAEAAGEFGGGQLAFTEERAEKVVGAALPFPGIAFQTTRDNIAVGIAA